MGQNSVSTACLHSLTRTLGRSSELVRLMTMAFFDIRMNGCGWFGKELTHNYQQGLALLGERVLDHYHILRCEIIWKEIMLKPLLTGPSRQRDASLQNLDEHH